MSTEDKPAGASHVDAWSATLVEPAAARASSLPPASRADGPVSVQPLELSRPLELVGEIGKGGMGAVLESFDPHILRHVAMKTLHAELGVDTTEVNRFIEEAQVTGQLEHPNVVPVYALSRDQNGQLFFTMKLVRGVTLAELLEEMGESRLDMENLERLIDIVIKVCDAVAFAHSKGVIHRDIKPQNLMIGGFGQVYVMDWGIADVRLATGVARDEERMLGTPAYMAPEQVRGVDIDVCTDVYGIGALLYVILTALHPNGGDNMNELLFNLLTEPVTPPEERVPELALPPELCRIAQKALSLHRNERHQSVMELRADLVAFQRGGGWLETRRYDEGEVVYRQGDDAAEAFFIAAGVCEVVHDHEGESEVLKELRAGDMLGEVALLSGGQRAATVIAREPLTVKVITRSSLSRELERSQWMRALFDSVASRFLMLEAVLSPPDSEH